MAIQDLENKIKIAVDKLRQEGTDKGLATSLDTVNDLLSNVEKTYDTSYEACATIAKDYPKRLSNLVRVSAYCLKSILLFYIV